MDQSLLPLQIASGILIAVVIVWVFKHGVTAAQRGEWLNAALSIAVAVLFGGGLIAAGTGLVGW